MFKVVYPSEVEQALRSIDGVDNAFVANVPGPQGDRVLSGGGLRLRRLRNLLAEQG
jgi:hypothetical protein